MMQADLNVIAFRCLLVLSLCLSVIGSGFFGVSWIFGIYLLSVTFGCILFGFYFGNYSKVTINFGTVAIRWQFIACSMSMIFILVFQVTLLIRIIDYGIENPLFNYLINNLEVVFLIYVTSVLYFQSCYIVQAMEAGGRFSLLYYRQPKNKSWYARLFKFLGLLFVIESIEAYQNTSSPDEGKVTHLVGETTIKKVWILYLVLFLLLVMVRYLSDDILILSVFKHGDHIAKEMTGILDKIRFVLSEGFVFFFSMFGFVSFMMFFSAMGRKLKRTCNI